ncbi:unnamed protein product [Oikopleura dioica]|uniref:Uncharacterized protein n=1 Tax=Oikopleura dioica TaxID=34765 RepID=E4X5M8_OIKDI|nr:unnamed protein product [Oikopleura dioica]
MQSRFQSFKKTTKNLLQHSIPESSSNQQISPNFPTLLKNRNKFRNRREKKHYRQFSKTEKNNCSQIVLENEQFWEEIEKLSKFMHIAEDRSEMIENIKRTIENLKSRSKRLDNDFPKLRQKRIC